VPDIYDSAKYDAIHNSELGLNMKQLYTVSIPALHGHPGADLLPINLIEPACRELEQNLNMREGTTSPYLALEIQWCPM